MRNSHPASDSNPTASRDGWSRRNVGVAAAVTDVVYHATGIRVRDLPIRLERLLV